MRSLGDLSVASDRFGRPNCMEVKPSMPGDGLLAHRDGYNVLYGDFSARWFGDPQQRIAWLDVRDGFYGHRPVLVTVNDYGVRLFNGDVGLILPEEAGGGRLYAFFQGADQRIRRVPLGRLPQHEPVFAMTVHKSQGSEFDEVLLVLPGQAGPILTRELVYTGVTRARKTARTS